MKILAQSVMEVTAAHFGLTVEDIKSQRRTRPYARARQVAMFCIRRLCPHMSYPEIGRRMGGRDHTTALHGVRKVEAIMATGELVADVHAILAAFPVDHRLEAEIAATEKLLSDATARLAILLAMRPRPKPLQVAA